MGLEGDKKPGRIGSVSILSLTAAVDSSLISLLYKILPQRGGAIPARRDTPNRRTCLDVIIFELVP